MMMKRHIRKKGRKSGATTYHVSSLLAREARHRHRARRPTEPAKRCRALRIPPCAASAQDARVQGLGSRSPA